MTTLKLLRHNIPILALFITVSGCSSPNQVYGLGVVPQNVTGDENSVSVFNVWSAGDALPLALNHCVQYKKLPEFERMGPITAYFKCK